MLEYGSGAQRWTHFTSLLQEPAQAAAILQGSEAYPRINGHILFYQTRYGVLAVSEVWGLPVMSETNPNSVFAFHIHEGRECSGDSNDPFSRALTHYNPGNRLHPDHAGDLPPLWGNHGYAFQIVLTDRFSVPEIIGRTVILHAAPDDFTTQPSGNSGSRIACGVIRKVS